MDGFLNPFFSPSSSWADTGAPERLSWVDATASQANNLLSDSMGVYGRDDKKPPMCMIPPNHIMEHLATHQSHVHMHDGTSSMIFGGNLKYDLKKFSGEIKPQREIPHCISAPSEHESEAHERGFSLQEMVQSYPSAGSISPELNNSCAVTLPHSTPTESGSVESNDSEPSVFPQAHGDSHSISTIPQLWTSSCQGVPSLVIGQGKLEGFGLQGEFMGTDGDILEKTLIEDDRLPQLDSFSASVNEFNKLQNSHLSSFASGIQMKLTGSVGHQPHQQVLQEQDELQTPHLPLTSGPQSMFARIAGLQTHRQLSQASEETKHYTNNSPVSQQPGLATANGSNSVMKPRVRARRGQATDPHSIAERLRREKIAERMKNLQELVPNSNKTDKASMLDEIIDYVKFLQLQVKVLSMSRLGAAGAVIPLITDVHAEESSGLLLSSSIGQADLVDSQDNLEFEQEVVKLMESNVTTAMQYLQNKGLCLMPIALASAISGRKGSPSAILPERRRKPDTNLGVTPRYNESMMKEWNGRAADAPDCNGVGVKQEESQKSSSNIRE